MSDFQRGDVVRLRSGGLPLTVDAVVRLDHNGQVLVFCLAWSEVLGDFIEAHLAPELLVRVENEGKGGGR